MCGIYCSIRRHGHGQVPEQVAKLLKQRGPDSFERYDLKVDDIYVTFVSTVLSLRGARVVPQPLIDKDTGSVLCWNGEAWKIEDEPVTGNDSRLIFDLLRKASVVEDSEREIIRVLSRVRGPYAFVFYHVQAQKIYLGRDCLGRRSLVKSTSCDGDVAVASICDFEFGSNWSEVEADGVYVLSLSRDPGAKPNSDPFAFRLIPHSHQSSSVSNGESITLPYPKLNMLLPNGGPLRLNLRSTSVSKLEKLLLKSMTLRTQCLPGAPSSPLAVLFSGGLDSTLLAYFSHLVLPPSTPIDLLNVAFQNPRIHKEDVTDPYSTCPDRITAISAHSTLQVLCQNREIRLLCINVPFSETCAHRQTILSLMHPHNTEMDLSIASALYFASRGSGVISATSGQPPITYSTPSRVLISGLGADELFGGYSRHAVAFGRHGYASLLDELDLDFNRLGKRNLGRDDRVTSHWGREVRYPFLDEDLIAWAVGAPGWEKCGFGMEQDVNSSEGDPDIEPGKLLLRLIAWKHGMVEVAKEKKRAIQFGSRTAKMHTNKSKGTDILLP